MIVFGHKLVVNSLLDLKPGGKKGKNLRPGRKQKPWVQEITNSQIFLAGIAEALFLNWCLI